MSQLIVAVEAVRQEQGVVAAAVVYAVTTTAPTFQYTDRRGRTKVVTLEEYARIPAPFQGGILRYLKRTALGYAVILKRDDDRQTAMCLAVARALERLAHVRGGLSRDRIVLHVVGKYLPTERVGRIDQRSWNRRQDAPWHLGAATVLAKAPRNVPMMVA